MNRILVAAATAALISLAGIGQALATTYIVYTSQFDVTSSTGCDYGGYQGTLVTLADGSEGCMVEASVTFSDGDAPEASAIDDDFAAAGDDEDDEGPATTFQPRRR